MDSKKSVVVLFAACTLSTSMLRAHDEQTTPDGNSQDLYGVVRVSWQLIDAVADDQVTAKVPFKSRFNSGTATGYVESQVDVTIHPVQITPSSGDETTVFLFKAEGNARGHFVARTSRFQIAGPISIPFSAERKVSFDGRYFTVGDASVAASVRTRFHRIRSHRNGLLGRFATGVAAPAIERRRANAERKASLRARRYVEKSVNRYTEEAVSRLNKVTPIEESLFRLYPDMADWPIRVSTDSDYLEAHYAPSDSPPIRPPEILDTHAAIEIWIRTTSAEAKFLERIGKWQQAQELLVKYLPLAGSEAGKLTSDTTVRSFGPWFVVSIGANRRAPLAEAESSAISRSKSKIGR